MKNLVRKIMAVGLGLGISLAGASTAFAANISYSADTTVTIGSTDYTIVSGSEATAVAVGATTITVTVPSGSSFAFHSSNKYNLNNNSGIAIICGGSYSEVEIVGAVTSGAVVITPDTSTTCSTASGGGGGGGGGSPSPTPTPTGTPTVTPTPTPTPTGTQNPPVTSGKDLSARFALVHGAIYDKQTGKPFSSPSDFFAAAGVSGFSNLNFDTGYTPSGSMTMGSGSGLTVGATKGDGVLWLQQFLNSQGFTVASKGAGSPGHETKLLGSATAKALKKFQKSVGLKQTGKLDKATVAYLQAHSY